MLNRIMLLSLMFLLIEAAPSVAQFDMDQLKKYTFVMLVSGENRDQPEQEQKRIQEEHLSYLNKLAADHDLNVAGPFLDDSEWRGILIFNTIDIEKVRELVENDPAVRAGRLKFEIHPWMTQKGITFN